MPDEFNETERWWEVNRDTLSDSDYEALANLRFTLRKFMNFSTSVALEEGLPSQQHQALLAIKGHPVDEHMTIGMLANRLLIAAHTATELVGRLSTAGLVTRNSDPTDKRRQTLELTEKADAVLLRLSAAHLKEVREMAPQLITILQRLQRDLK